MPVEHPSQKMTKRDYEAAKLAYASSRPETKRAAAPIEPSQVEGAGRLRKSEFYTGVASKVTKAEQEPHRTDAELLRDAAKEIDKALATEKGLQKADENALNEIIGRLSFGGRSADEKQALQDKLKQVWKIKDSIRREMERAKHAKSGTTADEADIAAANLREKLNRLVA